MRVEIVTVFRGKLTNHKVYKCVQYGKMILEACSYTIDGLFCKRSWFWRKVDEMPKKGWVTLTCNHSAKSAGILNGQGKIGHPGEGLKDLHASAQGAARATSSV